MQVFHKKCIFEPKTFFMKRLIVLLIVGVIISLPSNAQIGVYTATKSRAQESDVMPYDSTKNFLGNSNVKSYKGQILYVKGVSLNLQEYGYDNFYSTKSRGDGCRYGVPYGTFATGSPYDSLVGKYFIVKNIDDEKWYIGQYWFQLENRDDPNDTAWFYYDAKHEFSFPFIVLSYFEYLKQRYIGKEISYFGHRNEEFKIDVRKCINVGIEDKYYELSLFFEDGTTAGVKYDKEINPTGASFILTETYFNLLAQYGLKMAKCAVRSKICVGMPEELLLLSWGQPDEINRSSTNENDQWVYYNQYVYVKNGIITAWSD